MDIDHDGLTRATLARQHLLQRTDDDVVRHLLGMCDNLLLSHHDRTRVLPERHRGPIIRRNGDCLPTLLVHGHVAGVWRVVDDAIEATALEALDDDAWAGLDTEAASLLAFLDGTPPPFARYHHWWDKLPPPAYIRRLGG